MFSKKELRDINRKASRYKDCRAIILIDGYKLFCINTAEDKTLSKYINVPSSLFLGLPVYVISFEEWDDVFPTDIPYAYFCSTRIK